MFVFVESMRRLGLLSRELYPERLGVADCAYYMRTGSCAYGSKCRYHHPRDRSLVRALIDVECGYRVIIVRIWLRRIWMLFCVEITMDLCILTKSILSP